MESEQRKAQRGRVPTDAVVKQAATFPRDRLGEPMDITPENYDAWLAGVRARARKEGAAEGWGAAWSAAKWHDHVWESDPPNPYDDEGDVA